eukprot:272752_1
MEPSYEETQLIAPFDNTSHQCTQQNESCCIIDEVTNQIKEQQYDPRLISQFQLCIHDEQYDTEALTQDLELSLSNVSRLLAPIIPFCQLLLSNPSLIQCLCFKRISSVLQTYEANVSGQMNHDSKDNIDDICHRICESIGNNYNTVDLLNDFHHLMDIHFDHFEAIGDILKFKTCSNQPCDASVCLCMQRHEHREEQKEGMRLQNVIDRIHCYYLHPNSHKNTAHKQVVRYDKYDCGFRFFYHKYYKDNLRYDDPVAQMTNINLAPKHQCNEGYTVGEMYIPRKYCNLKEEMLNNSICAITLRAWGLLHTKVMVYIQSRIGKSMKCVRKSSAVYYEMQYEQRISMRHLAAAMVHCNFDELQFRVAQTFRAHKQEESIESIKQRHSNYYWLARSLRECCECFGMKTGHQTLTVYAGINNIMGFETIYPQFRHPFSMYRDMLVASRFAESSGMLLELTISELTIEGSSRICCFDMQWLSDYAMEQEIFTVGGLHRVCIRTMIHPSTHVDYRLWIRGIKQLTSGMGHGPISMDVFTPCIPQTKEEQQLVSRLLSHQFCKYFPGHQHADPPHSVADYIKDLMDSLCKKITFIQFFDTTPKHKMHDLYFKHDESYIKLNELTRIFPNVYGVKSYIHNDDALPNHKLYSSVLDFIDRNTRRNGRYNCTLREIHFSVHPSLKRQLEQLVTGRWETQFLKRGWTIGVTHYDHTTSLSDIIGIDIRTLLQRSADSTETVIKQLENICRLLSPTIHNLKTFSIWDDFGKFEHTVLWMRKLDDATLFACGYCRNIAHTLGIHIPLDIIQMLRQNIGHVMLKRKRNLRIQRQIHQHAGAGDEAISCCDPPTQCRAKGNIQISNKMIHEVIPKRTSGWNDHYYLRQYIDKATAMCLNSEGINGICEYSSCVLNYNLHDKNNGETLYCVVDKQAYGCLWTMRNRLFTAAECMRFITELPAVPQRMNVLSEQLKYRTKVIELLMWSGYESDTIVGKTQWSEITVFDRERVDAAMLSWIETRFDDYYVQFVKNKANIFKIKLIPIVMFDKHNSHWIEWVRMIRIDMNKECVMNIGMSLKYNSEMESLKMTGLYLDKHNIDVQHKLACPQHDCDCLDEFAICAQVPT